MKIYVVIGSTGEYSDRREWFLKAYTNEEDAKILVENATMRANQIHILAIEHCNFYKIDEKEEAAYINEYDPNMQMDYSDTRYYYKEVELVD